MDRSNEWLTLKKEPQRYFFVYWVSKLWVDCSEYLINKFRGYLSVWNQTWQKRLLPCLRYVDTPFRWCSAFIVPIYWNKRSFFLDYVFTPEKMLKAKTSQQGCELRKEIAICTSKESENRVSDESFWNNCWLLNFLIGSWVLVSCWLSSLKLLDKSFKALHYGNVRIQIFFLFFGGVWNLKRNWLSEACLSQSNFQDNSSEFLWTWSTWLKYWHFDTGRILSKNLFHSAKFCFQSVTLPGGKCLTEITFCYDYISGSTVQEKTERTFCGDMDQIFVFRVVFESISKQIFWCVQFIADSHQFIRKSMLTKKFTVPLQCKWIDLFVGFWHCNKRYNSITDVIFLYYTHSTLIIPSFHRLMIWSQFELAQIFHLDSSTRFSFLIMILFASHLWTSIKKISDCILAYISTDRCSIRFFKLLH